jgi:hypothetical protein
MAKRGSNAPQRELREVFNVNAEMLMDRLSNLTDEEGKIKVSDPGLERAGTKIVLPALPQPMSVMEGIGTLVRYMQEEETEMAVTETINAFPQDAAVAFYQAIKDIYGFANSVPTPGFWGDDPPEYMTVATGPGPDDYVQVPWGSFQVPNIENRIEIKAQSTPDGAVTVLVGMVKKREQSTLLNLAKKTREILSRSSIYRGKTINLRPDSAGKLNLNTPPTFFDPGTNGEELILNPDELAHVQGSLWAPIQNKEACIKHKIPLRRGVLLEGTYGTGKSLTAKITAQVCLQNGWTFIMLDDVRALKDALVFAKRYQPCVVFAEDIDRLIQDRDQAGNDLLNTIDGVLSKDSQVITCLTTNHVEKINRAMLRPGRLDAVISIRPPQSEAVQRLIRLYGRKLVVAETLDRVGEKLAGNIPATIREVVERAKLGMIYHRREVVTEDDLLAAALGCNPTWTSSRTSQPTSQPLRSSGKPSGRLSIRPTAWTIPRSGSRS